MSYESFKAALSVCRFTFFIFNLFMEISAEKEKTVILEMELDEWKKKNGALEESLKTAFKENEILKREVDQLKVQLQELRTKQANVQEVEEVNLLRTKTEESAASNSSGKSGMIYS